MFHCFNLNRKSGNFPHLRMEFFFVKLQEKYHKLHCGAEKMKDSDNSPIRILIIVSNQGDFKEKFK